jgi:hypothetical protein
LGDKVYVPGKWTVRDIMQHVIDAERIFAYRALRFARNDKTVLPSFDENVYAVTAHASKRDLDELIEEFYSVRDASTKLFNSFSNEMLVKEGEIWSGTCSVVGMGFIIAGHFIHHIGVLKERYYGL